MRYDSTPPVYYDDPAVHYDEPDASSSQPRTRMDYVALKLNQKTLDQKLDFTTMLAANLTTYVADYASPPITPTQLTGKVTAINAKKAEVAAAQTVLDTKQSDLAALEEDLDNSLIAIGSFIQDKSGGVAAKITELGVEIQAAPNAPVTPSAPQNFRVSAGDNPGEVKTACDADPNAKGYKYQTSTNPNDASLWVLKDSSSGCRHVLTGCTSGQKLYIRMCAVGKKRTGDGPWSDIASVTVP
jgi:hypothetical protein